MALVQDGYLAPVLGATKQIWSILTKAFQKPLAEGELELLIYFDTTVADEANLPTEEIQFNIELSVALVDMKENVLEIELELTWWTSVLNISSPVLDTADWKEDNVVTMALEHLKTFYDKLTVEGSSLQVAASIDYKNLQAMLAQVKSKGALSAKKKVVYSLSVYSLSRLNDSKSDSFAKDSIFVDRHFCELRRTESELGSGSYGKVVEVTWMQRVKCAMKVIKAEWGSPIPDKLKKESHILKFCCHRNIVQFIWSWEQENEDNEIVPHILMERMHTDLATLIEKQTKDEAGSPFELQVAIDIMLQIAKATRIFAGCIVWQKL